MVETTPTFPKVNDEELNMFAVIWNIAICRVNLVCIVFGVLSISNVAVNALSPDNGCEAIMSQGVHRQINVTFAVFGTFFVTT
jgi:hypothetical protein